VLIRHILIFYGGRMTRIPIRLSEECLSALRVLALQEYRDIRQQAAWMIEQDLERRGLLVVETQSDPAPIALSADSKPNKGGMNVSN